MYCKSGSVHGRVPAALCVPTEVILVTYNAYHDRLSWYMYMRIYVPNSYAAVSALKCANTYMGLEAQLLLLLSK